MIGIYLTTDGKEAIEYRIDELEKVKDNCEKAYEWNQAVIEQNVYKEILYSATILPVEESWEHGSKFTNVKYKQGVIIQPLKPKNHE
jgi:hypothetical protein